MRTSLPIALSLTFVTSLTAQSTQPVPAHADAVDGQRSQALPFGKLGFRTQILIDAASVATTQAVLTGIRFRADRASSPQAARSLPNVTVSLSHSSVGLGGLQTTFASNVTGAATQVFSGTVSLPAQATGYDGPMGWDTVITFPTPYVFTSSMGDLLIDIVGNNAAGGSSFYYLDAMQGGGSATTYGVAGDNPSFDSLQLLHLMRDADWDIPVVLVVENADEVRTSPAVAAGRTEVVAKTELTEGLLAAIAAAMTREESAPPTVPERRSGVRLTSTCDREELGDDAPRQSA